MRCWITSSMELPHVGLDEQVPHLRKLERFVYQQWQKVCKPFLLGPHWSHQDQQDACQVKNPGENLPEKSKRQEGIGGQMVPRVLEVILLPRERVQYRGHIQRKLSVRSSGKEVEMGTAEHTADPHEHLRKKGPFPGKNLVGTAELVRQNVLPSRKVPRRQVNRMPLGPHSDLGGHETQDPRHHAALMVEISDNRGIVAHQDDTPPQQLRQLEPALLP